MKCRLGFHDYQWKEGGPLQVDVSSYPLVQMYDGETFTPVGMDYRERWTEVWSQEFEACVRCGCQRGGRMKELISKEVSR